MAGIEVIIGANTDGLDAAVSRSRRTVNQLSDDLKQGIGTVAKYGAATAAAGIAVGVLAVKSIEAAREVVGLARVANSSVATFQKMAFGAKSVGVESGQLADILKDMSDRVGDFITTGGGPMADFFEQIAPQVGVTAEQFRKLSGPDALQLYVSSLEKANLSQSEMTFFMEAIANDSTRLLPLLRNNGAAMAEQARQAEALGLALSDIDAKNITDAAAQIDRVTSVFGAFSDQMAAEISPLVSALGRQFLGLAEDAGGVGEAAAKSFNVVVDGIAIVANALDAMDRKLLESETAVDQFALAFRIGLLEIAREIVEIPTAAINELIGLINNIPGVKEDFLGMSDFGLVIQGQINDTKDEIGTLQSALNDELMKPLNGDLFKRLVVEAQEAAEASAAAAGEITGGTTGGRGTNTPGDQDAPEGAPEDEPITGTEKDKLEKRLEAIREANMSEREIQLEKFALENEDLAVALEQQLITKQEWAALSVEQKQREEDALTEIEERAAAERTKIKEQEARNKAAAERQFWSDATSLMNSGSRKMFEIGKAASIAQAVVKGQSAAVSAWEAGMSTGGPHAPVVAAAYTAASLAKTAGQISAIRSATYGGGGGSGGGGGGGSVTQGINNQSEPVQPPTETMVANLNIQGQNFDRRTVIGLVEQINDLQEDGMRIRLNTV